MRAIAIALLGALAATADGYAGACRDPLDLNRRTLYSHPSFSRVCSLSASEGKVNCWGPASGETNLPSFSINSQVDLSMGGDPRTCTVGADTRIRCWGYDPWGALDGTPTGPGWAATAGSYTNQYALRESDGAVISSGLGNDCRLCSQGFGQVAVSGGSFHACSLDAYGGVYCWGWPGNWRNGNSIPGPAQYGQVMVAPGVHVTCSLSALGDVTCWGYNDYGTASVPPSAQTGQSFVSCGDLHCCSVSRAGRVTCWGYNDLGQATVPLAALSNQVSVTAGVRHTCSLSAGGNVTCWGTISLVPGSSQQGVEVPCLRELPTCNGDSVHPGQTPLTNGQLHTCVRSRSGLVTW